MFIFLSLFLGLAHALPLEIEQYPEERNYGVNDRGFMQYTAPSMYHTSKYALTFDDGPHSKLTPLLLDLLKKHNVKATFFVITSRVDATTLPILKRALDEGHILAAHGVEHFNSNQLTEKQFKDNVKNAVLKLKEVYAAAGHEYTQFYYRYPYAAYGTRTDYHQMNAMREVSYELFGDNCLQFVFWDIDSADWVPNMTPADVFQNLKAYQEGGTYFDFKTVRDSQGRTTYVKVPVQLKDPTQGGVILQHDIQEKTIEGTRMFLEYAKTNGLSLVSLPEIQEFAIQRECRFLK
ncbi:MAG: polysaccharide deacetylase family protein [Bacteriovoracaceae bacterium]|nr:polysaccharide deacetylase family protein [Bacteriovoracaceae bacterium]